MPKHASAGQDGGMTNGPASREDIMPNDLKASTTDLIDRLRAEGHHDAADRLAHHLGQEAEHGAMFALRELAQTLLTAIEAIDPVTQTMVEDLRLEVDKRLKPHL
jgi:hypothetical protein